MNIAELKVLITGDDSGVRGALERTSQALQESKDAAQALSDKLAELKETTTLGADATDRQTTVYEALAGKFGDVRTAVQQLNQAYDQLEARTKSDEGWQRFSEAMNQAKLAVAQAAIQSRDDKNAFEAFGVMFSNLAPSVKEYVSELGKAQLAAEQLAKRQPEGIAAAIALLPSLNEKLAEAAARQRELNAEVLKQVQANQQLIVLGGKGTQVERQLWDVQEGRFKAISPLMKAVLELQAKLIQQSADQAKIDEAMRSAQLEHAKLTATTDEERVSVQVLDKTYEELSETQKDLITNVLTPLTEANKKLSDEQRKQAQIGIELNRQLARQYADIAKAGSGLGPLDDVLKSILLDTTQLTPENQKLLDQIKKMQPAVEAFQTLSKGIMSLFDHVFQDLFDHGFKGFFSNVLQGFQKMLADMAQEWAKAQLTRTIQQGLGGLFGGGSALGSLGFGSMDALGAFMSTGWDVESSGSFLSLFARASGGPVDAGQPYLVGEEGPELFVPSGAGAIVSNGALQSSSGGPIVVNNHFRIETPNPAAFRQSIGQLAAETGAAVHKHLRRNS